MTPQERHQDFESLAIGKLILLNKIIQQELEKGMEPHGLSLTQAKAICTLSHMGPMNQRQLAGHIQIEPATLVRVVDHMEAEGYLTRTQTPSDRRSHTLLLTPKGEALDPLLWKNLNQVNQKLLSGLKEEERRMLETALGVLFASLQTDPTLVSHPPEAS